MKYILRTTLLFCIFEQLLVNVDSLNDSQGMNYELIEDYLKGNNLKIGILVSCTVNQDNMKSLTSFRGKSDIWYRLWDISNDVIDFETILIRLSHQVGVVIDLNCSEIVEFLRGISKRMFFHRERSWLMFSTDLNQTHNLLQKENINVDAEISIAIPIEDGDKKMYNLYDAYNPSSTRGGKLNVTQTGTWSTTAGYNLFNDKPKLENRRDFHGITFKGIVTLPSTPNNETFLGHLESSDAIHINSMSRFNYRLFQIMEQMYNFKIFLQRAHMWGYLKNGFWQGALGMLSRKEVDISVSGLQWENENYGALEATTNTYAVRTKFIFRHPKIVDAAHVFTTPFTNIAWICILFICVASSYFLRQIFVVENHRKIKTNFADRTINEDSWSNSLLLVFGIILQQGYANEPILISSRIVTLTVLLFSLLIFQFYSSFIVGSLLTEPPKTIKTMKQLLHCQLEFGLDDMPYIVKNFEQSIEESAVKLYHKIMQTRDESVMTVDKGLNLIKRGGFALNTDVSRSYLMLKNVLTDDEMCDIQDVAYARENPTGPSVPYKSPLTELIKISIRRMAETGVLAYHSKTWIGSKSECQKTVIDFVPVDLVHFSTALYLIMSGIPVSTLILLAEIIVHRYQTLNEKLNMDTKDVLKMWFSCGKIEGEKM